MAAAASGSLEVGGDTVSLQQVVQDLQGKGLVSGGRAPWGGGARAGQGLTMSGVVPIFLASSPRSMVLRYR